MGLTLLKYLVPVLAVLGLLFVVYNKGREAERDVWKSKVVVETVHNAKTTTAIQNSSDTIGAQVAAKNEVRVVKEKIYVDRIKTVLAESAIPVGCVIPTEVVEQQNKLKEAL